MDAKRFDALTRSVSEHMSRRRLLRAIGAGIATALTGQRALGAPRCKQVDQVCKTTADCCPEENGTYCAGTKKLTCQPCAGTICKGGCTICPPTEIVDPTLNCACVCRPGLTRCNGVCVDLQTDPANCGACGQSCDDGDVCSADTCLAGQCASTAIPGCCTGDAECEDGDLCTTNTCVANQCQSIPVICTGGDVCTGVQCVSGIGCQFFSLCFDGDDCTEDLCDQSTGECSYPPLTGNSCVDPITGRPGTCNDGVCEPQLCPPGADLCDPVFCDLGNGCECAETVDTGESFCSGVRPGLCLGDACIEDPDRCPSIFGPGARCVYASCCAGRSACAPPC